MESICVQELGATLSKEEIHKILVTDMPQGAIEVDWRDFFPYLKWIPNRCIEMKIQGISSRRLAVTNALVNEEKKRIASGEVVFCSRDTGVSIL